MVPFTETSYCLQIPSTLSNLPLEQILSNCRILHSQREERYFYYISIICENNIIFSSLSICITHPTLAQECLICTERMNINSFLVETDSHKVQTVKETTTESQVYKHN